MPHFPVLRWGEPYESLDVQDVVHFATGETLAQMSKANPGLVTRDMRKAHRVPEILREFSIDDLCQRLATAGDLFRDETLPAGGGEQTPAQFVTYQSATTGLPEHMCRANMEKLHYVLANLRDILRALTRELDPSVISDGYAIEDGIMRSRQPMTPALGMVLPSNSPGTHGLWLPVVALQVGLVLKPGSQEPWTAYRMAEAYARAGIPREVLSLYPGGADIGQAVIDHVPRTMIFGSQKTIDQFSGNPRVQVHGPGYSKILLGDDVADNWEQHLDLMVDSVLVNGGRSCINCSGIWTPRHGAVIADAIAARIGPVEPLPPEHPDAPLAAFTVAGQAEGIDAMIESRLAQGGTDVAATHRDGPRLITAERCGYLRPTVVHCPSPDVPLADTEFMFPFVSVVDCPQDQMLDRIGDTLVGTVITDDPTFRRAAVNCGNIDRLNLGPIPTFRLDWMQPHEGNILDFLYRERAVQVA